MTTYTNIVVSGVPMRAKVGGPERGGESVSPVGDVKHGQFAWLTRKQKRALPKGVGYGSHVTVRWPSIGKEVGAELKRWSNGAALLDFDEGLDLTADQAREILASKQMTGIRR